MAKAKKRKKAGSKRKNAKRKPATRRKKRKGVHKVTHRKSSRSKHIPLGILKKRLAKLHKVVASRS